MKRTRITIDITPTGNVISSGDAPQYVEFYCDAVFIGISIDARRSECEDREHVLDGPYEFELEKKYTGAYVLQCDGGAVYIEVDNTLFKHYKSLRDFLVAWRIIKVYHKTK